MIPTRPASRRAAPLRAVTAVIALYAFVLHAVLGGLAPLPSAVDHGVLCLGLTDGDATPETGSPASGRHAHAPCCTVPDLGSGALVPDPAARAVAWPRRTVHRLAWRTGAPAWARGPPGTIAHPRGPPVV